MSLRSLAIAQIINHIQGKRRLNWRRWCHPADMESLHLAAVMGHLLQDGLQAC
jgi:hypothetical protein